jgi:hypothetical protein
LIESKEWVNRILLYNNMLFERIILESYKKVKLERPENILLLIEISGLECKLLKVYVSSSIEKKKKLCTTFLILKKMYLFVL